MFWDFFGETSKVLHSIPSSEQSLNSLTTIAERHYLSRMTEQLKILSELFDPDEHHLDSILMDISP
jgi:hypothetical protein